MQQKTDKCVDRLRLQQYYDLTANDFVDLQAAKTPSQIQTGGEQEGELAAYQGDPNKFISPSIINNRINRLKRLEGLNARGGEFLDPGNVGQEGGPDQDQYNEDGIRDPYGEEQADQEQQEGDSEKME